MFGASIFLAGLAAVGVPVAIHLLARQRTRVLGWGAMEFLKESISSASSRRNKLRDLLLLALRMLAVFFLVLTFAQPLASRLAFGGSGLETIFIWDVSLSTRALDAQGKPRAETMREALRKELDRLPDGSSVRILLAGSEVRWLKPTALVLSANNRQALEQAIREQRTELGGSQLASAILLALAEKRELSDVRQRQLILIQDFHRRAWQTEDSDRWEIIRQKLAQDPETSLRLAETGPMQAGDGPQVAVVSLEPDRDAIAMKTPVRFRAGLRNLSAENVSDATVLWLVDGREVERASGVQISTEVELKLEQALSFETEGSHQVECRIEVANDPLPEDNSASAVVFAHRPLPVLIVDDTIKTLPGQILPSEFLVASLGGSLGKPKDKQATKTDNGSLFGPKVMASADLTTAALAGSVAVIAANALHLPEDTVGELSRFVKNGGGLWLMTNTTEETQPEWRTRLMRELGLDSLVGVTRRMPPSAEVPFQVVAANPTGEFATRMAARGLDLFRSEMAVIYELDQPALLAEEKLLETPDGKPVLLSLPVGAGRLVLQMNDLSRENSNLPVLQSFVPFVRETLRNSLGGILPRRNLDQGQPIRIPLLNLPDQSDTPSVTPPDGVPRELTLLGGEYQTAHTQQSGLYRVSSLRDAAGDPKTELFAVKRPVAESELSWMTEMEAATLFQNEPGVLPEPQTTPTGRWPLALWFAVLTALFFLAEAVLAHFLVRRRESSGRRIELKPVF